MFQWKGYDAGVEEAITMCAEDVDEDDPSAGENFIGEWIWESITASTLEREFWWCLSLVEIASITCLIWVKPKILKRKL